MKHSDELYAKAIAALDIGYSHGEALYFLAFYNREDCNGRKDYELMCHRVHKALRDKFGDCCVSSLNSSFKYEYGVMTKYDGLDVYVDGAGSTDEEAIKNAAVDYYEKEKGGKNG